MMSADQRWSKLFLFSVGIAIGTGFCMQWIANDFWIKGEKFTVIGLELFYSKEKIVQIVAGIDSHVKWMLDYHLHFDFVFMAGIFPGAASLCMMAGNRLESHGWKKFFLILASIQLLAWAGDITENLYLLKWLKDPVIGGEFALYRFIVAGKWIIGLLAAFFAVPVLLGRRKKKD
jgi:hypothetical protein